MSQDWFAFLVGVVIGGLSLSACWGLFWLAVGVIGIVRGTCGWRVVLNSLTVGAVPLLLIAALVWWHGAGDRLSPVFGAGLLSMPVLLFGLGLRQTPDGRRAGIQMLSGVRGLMDEILGRHQGCGGCSHEHDHEGHA